MSSFATTTAEGKKSVTTVDFGSSEPQFKRNWVGTIIGIIIIATCISSSLSFLGVISAKINNPDYTGESGGLELDFFTISTLVSNVAMLGLTIWLAVTFFYALRKPLFLWGPDSEKNIRSVKYYLVIAFSLFMAKALIDLGFALSSSGQATVVNMILLGLYAAVIILIYLSPNLILYIAWRKKNQPNTLLVKLFMPFRPVQSKQMSV